MADEKSDKELYTLFTDADTRRDRIRDHVMKGIENTFPLKGKHYSLELDKFHVNKKKFSPNDQKKALMEKRTLVEPLKGTVKLKDKDGKVVNESTRTLAHVPYLTERHTFVMEGNEYSVSNQVRIKPGVYTRRRGNGELEAAFNLAKGRNFRLMLEPERGVIFMQYASSKIPLYPVLRAMGVGKNRIKSVWGKELTDINHQYSAGKEGRYLRKLYKKAIPEYRRESGATQDDIVRQLKETYDQTVMDPEVNEMTLGEKINKVNAPALLKASRKLVKVYNNEEKPDDRDSLAFKTLHTVESFMKERIDKDASRDLRKKAVRKLNQPKKGAKVSDMMGTAPFTKSLHKFLKTSALSNTPMQINPMEMLDSATKITALGEGGISSTLAVPDEARDVHSSHLGLLDPIRTPESQKAGIDVRGSIHLARDDDGNMYTPVINAKTGKSEYQDAKKLFTSRVAFPGQDLKKRKKEGKNVDIVDEKGEVRSVSPDDVDYQIPYAASMYSPTTNLVPMLNNAMGNRNIMGSKFQTQAVPLLERETPYVQTASWRKGKTVEDEMGEKIAPVAPVDGKVEKVDDEFVYIRPNKRQKRAEYTIPVRAMTAVVIKGNPKYVKNNPKADRYYNEIKDYLEQKGYEVSFDPGKPYTQPEDADLWIGHSRGVDRLRFAPSGTKTLAFGAPDDDAYSHPVDRQAMQSFEPGNGEYTPPDEHYVFTAEQKQAIDRIATTEKTAETTHTKELPDGTTLDIIKLFDVVRGKPFESVNIDDLKLLSESPRDGFSEKRLAKADTSYPVIVDADNRLIDGRHRAVKLKQQGEDTVQAVRATLEDLGAVTLGDDDAPTVMKTAKANVEYTDDGLAKVPRSNYFPMASKTYLHDEITAKPGDEVKKGDALGENNFTHGKTLALGKNLKTAYMPYYGYNSNDAVVVSEGASKKLTSTHMYTESLSIDQMTVLDREKHKNYFGSKYDKNQYSKLSSKGVIRQGETVEHGELLIAAMKENQARADSQILGKLHKSLVKPYRDIAVVWEHQFPGEITDVSITENNITVAVKTDEPAQIGDKLANRFGAKGVISKIVPDDKMIKNEKDEPLDLLLTSAGIITRTNPNQIIETAVAKVAEKTGKRVVVPQYVEEGSEKDRVKWAKDLLKKHGIKDKETVYDPVSDKKIPGVFTGPQYTFKMFKSADTNYAARGIGPGYDINKQPTKGGEEGAKSVGKMEFNALISHNARNILNEVSNVKSQKNDEYWRRVQLGLPTKTPGENFAFKKFKDTLMGAGINVKKKGSRFALAPLTDKDIDKVAKGTVENPLLVKTRATKDGQKIMSEKGGLFDPTVTGGMNGDKYAKIELAEPVVNPIFEDPARRLLGMSKREFQRTRDENGAKYIRNELNKLDLDQKEEELRKEAKRRKGSGRNNAIKQIKYIRALRKEELNPGDAYVLNKLPVTPPKVRPIMPNPDGTTLVSDANYLYRDVMLADKSIKETPDELKDDDELKTQRKHLHDAVGALFGTNDPVSPQNKGRGVKGHLQQITGTSSPKNGYFQSKLMKRRQDLSGRATIAPDHTLGMDEVGLPEGMGWKMYEPFIIKELIKKGYSAVEAREKVEDKHPAARRVLETEVKKRPVMVNRAPTLHRYNMISAYPKLIPGKTLRLNPFAESGMNADYDGDALQVHTPVSDAAVKEAKGMTLSNLLFGDRSKDDLMVFPAHEAIIGTYMATRDKSSGPAKKFKTKADAMAAYKRGDLKLSDRVVIENKR